MTNTAAARTFIAKWDLTTSSELREYQFVVASDDTLSFSTYDESTNVATVRASDAAISMGAQHLYAVTYDGAGGATAGNTMALYEDGAAIASTATNNGSYVAMEDTDTIVRIAAIENASGVAADFMAGNMGMILVTATELNADQNWAIKEAVNAYYGLTL